MASIQVAFTGYPFGGVEVFNESACAGEIVGPFVGFSLSLWRAHCRGWRGRLCNVELGPCQSVVNILHVVVIQ